MVLYVRDLHANCLVALDRASTSMLLSCPSTPQKCNLEDDDDFER